MHGQKCFPAIQQPQSRHYKSRPIRGYFIWCCVQLCFMCSIRCIYGIIHIEDIFINLPNANSFSIMHAGLQELPKIQPEAYTSGEHRILILRQQFLSYVKPLMPQKILFSLKCTFSKAHLAGYQRAKSECYPPKELRPQKGHFDCTDEPLDLQTSTSWVCHGSLNCLQYSCCGKR